MQECGCNHSSNIVTTDSKRSKKENMFDFDVEVQIHVLQDFGLEAILLNELTIACHPKDQIILSMGWFKFILYMLLINCTNSINKQ